jgi:hypothetical protein
MVDSESGNSKIENAMTARRHEPKNETNCRDTPATRISIPSPSNATMTLGSVVVRKWIASCVVNATSISMPRTIGCSISARNCGRRAERREECAVTVAGYWCSNNFKLPDIPRQHHLNRQLDGAFREPPENANRSPPPNEWRPWLALLGQATAPDHVPTLIEIRAGPPRDCQELRDRDLRLLCEPCRCDWRRNRNSRGSSGMALFPTRSREGTRSAPTAMRTLIAIAAASRTSSLSARQRNQIAGQRWRARRD